jgi:hypothetical protein
VDNDHLLGEHYPEVHVGGIWDICVQEAEPQTKIRASGQSQGSIATQESKRRLIIGTETWNNLHSRKLTNMGLDRVGRKG